MKIHDLFLYVALVGIVVIWSACSEDKGNYDYAALNEVLLICVKPEPIFILIRESGV